MNVLLAMLNVFIRNQEFYFIVSQEGSPTTSPKNFTLSEVEGLKSAL
jgi:hypothetical protein